MHQLTHPPASVDIRRLEKLFGEIREEGVEHPHHDGNMESRIHDKQSEGTSDQTQALEPGVQGDDHRHRRQKYGGDEPHVHPVPGGPLSEFAEHQHEGRGNTQQEAHHRTGGHLQNGVSQKTEHISIPEHPGEGFQSGPEEKSGSHRLGLGFEGREEHVENRKEVQYRHNENHHRHARLAGIPRPVPYTTHT